MDDAERDRLLGLIVTSNEVILDEGNSPDPVAERRVAEALRVKGRALLDLERYAESVLIWDDILARFADMPTGAKPGIALKVLASKAKAERALGRDEDELDTLNALLDLAGPRGETGVLRLVAAAMHRKRELLMALERQTDAIGVDDEIVRRLGEADDPRLRIYVAYALMLKAQELLGAGVRFPEAMSASEKLVARLEHEPSETAVPVAELISAHIERLTTTGRPTPPSMVANLLLTLAMTATEAAGAVVRRQPLELSQLPGRRFAQQAFRRLPRGGIDEKLSRYEHALAASDAVVARSKASEDPELKRVAVQTQIQSATALTALGRVHEVMAIAQLLESSDPSVVQAVQALADIHGQTNSTLHQIQTVSLLSTRARALGGKDRYIQRVAYDDSILAHQGQAPRPRIVRVIARLLRPRTGSAGIPDDASEILGER